MMWTSGETLTADLTRDVKKNKECTIEDLTPNFKIDGGRRGPREEVVSHQMSYGGDQRSGGLDNRCQIGSWEGGKRAQG